MSDTPSPEAASEPLARVLEAEDRVVAALEEIDALEANGDCEAVGPIVTAVLEEPGREVLAAERAELCFRGGAAAEASNDEETAQELFEAALTAEPGHQAALLSVANLLYRRGELEQAEKTYRTLLARHRDDLDPASRAEAYYRLARIRIDEVGDKQRARAVVEKALSSLPSHRAARRLLIDLHRADENWEKVVAHERRLLDFEEDTQSRYEALLAVADTAAEHLADEDVAERFFLDAAALRPQAPAPWERLLTYYLTREDRTAAIRALTRLTTLTGAGPAARGAWYAQMARLYRDDLDDVESAVACFQQSLDLDPSQVDVFGECEELLEADEDWLALEQHHRRMLARLGRSGSPKVRAALWKNLAELYRTRLEDPDQALLAAEAVCDLQPNDLSSYLLAEELMGTRDDLDPDRVRSLHRRMLGLDPERLDSIRALRRVELRVGRVDAAWLFCARLAEAGDIQPDEEAYLENLRRPGLPQVERPLTDELWFRYLIHADARTNVAHLLSLALPALLSLYARESKHFGAKKRHRIDPHGPLLFARVLLEVASSLGMPEPPSAYQSKKRQGISVAPASPPIVLVGSEMLSGRSHREIAFELARTLALFRADFLPTVYVPEETLPWLVRCIVGRYSPELAVARDPAAEAVERALERDLDQREQAELKAVALRIADVGESALDTGGYLHGVAATRDRVGLLFGEDLTAAIETVAAERRPGLVGFAISEEYVALRDALGIAHRVQDDG